MLLCNLIMRFQLLTSNKVDKALRKMIMISLCGVTISTVCLIAFFFCYLQCIELYIKEDDNERVGFYSLEMAPDLELDPKQYHVVAFADPRDCKSFCYILQAHMEMLGNGCAFVVARPPKVNYWLFFYMICNFWKFIPASFFKSCLHIWLLSLAFIMNRKVETQRSEEETKN